MMHNDCELLQDEQLGASTSPPESCRRGEVTRQPAEMLHRCAGAIDNPLSHGSPQINICGSKQQCSKPKSRIFNFHFPMNENTIINTCL